MDTALRLSRAVGWCWCWSKPKVKDRFDLQPFLLKRLPIFWIMGPGGCGKTTLGTMLGKSSKYQCIEVGNLVQEEISKGKFRSKVIEECIKKGYPVLDEIVITLIKEELSLNCQNSKGIIIIGFPIHLRQAKLFELEICKVNIIIYCTLVLDALLGREITRNGDVEIEKVRVKFVVSSKQCQSVYRYFEHKTVKVMTNYPPEETVTKLVTDLEDFWGYKFDRLYNKN